MIREIVSSLEESQISVEAIPKTQSRYFSRKVDQYWYYLVLDHGIIVSPPVIPTGIPGGTPLWLIK